MWETLLGCFIFACSLGDTTASTSRYKIIPWLAVNAGYGAYAMGDVNDRIQAIDAQTTAEFEDITGGPFFGIEAGIEMTPMFGLGLGYQRLLASSSISDASGTLEFNLPARLLLVFIQLNTPPGRRISAGADVGIGLLTCLGGTDFTPTGSGTHSGSLDAKSSAFQGTAYLDITVHKDFIVSPFVGYRRAVLGDVKSRDQQVLAIDGSPYEIDYSGLIAGVKLKVRFPGSRTAQ